MHKDVESILVSEKEIEEIVLRIAGEINKNLNGEPLLVVVILKGSTPFAMDLIKKLDMPVEIDFMQVSSYGKTTESNGFINVKRDLEQDVTGKNVLIVEDIIDSGNTLYKIKALFQDRKAKTVQICTLLDKPSRRVVDVNVDYVGKEIPDEFAIGYGLDYCEHYRNLPYVGVLKRSVYEK
ncbi:MAG: hypoxanthine phosphoribosyltransferase [Ruminococcaceae bacterium]|nr:hypoxanthine phosphoribosyltransferase [Oscillospiraceae bacterium]